MKVIEYPETRQVFSFDCGANALVSVLVFAGLEEREDRVAVLAGTTKAGTSTEGILRVLRYYGLPFRDASGCGPTICGKPSTTAILRWSASSLPRIEPALP